MSDYTDLIADARVWPRDGVSKGPLINALADAIESLVKERDELAAVIEDALAFCREQHDSIRGQFDQTGGAPAEYIGFANACGDVVGILSAYTKGTN